METILANNKQMFNASQIAFSTNIENLTDGQFAVFAEGSDTSVASGTNFSTLPDKFYMAVKRHGRLYRSFDTIDKSQIIRKNKQPYTAPVSNIWQTVIEHCNCIKGFNLTIHVEDMCRIQDEGMTWAHKDFVVDVQPKELQCLCSCDGKFPVYENNVITKLLVEKVTAMKSPYYNAFATIDVSGIDVEDDLDDINALEDPTTGQLVINDDTNELLVYTGTAWVVVGTSAGLITDLGVFVEALKTINTDSDDTNNGPMLQFNIESAIFPTPEFKDLDVNYCYPRGIHIKPAITVNNMVAMPFTEIQAMVFELNAGYDLRAEEWDVMSYSYPSGHYPVLSDGIAAANLKYQFANNVNYNVISFEFLSPNTTTNDGRNRLFGVKVASATNISGLYTALQTLFGV